MTSQDDADDNCSEGVTPPVMEPGAALMTRIAEGDLEAFAALYDSWAPDVHRLALRLLGEPGSAEDTTQDVLLSVWRTADRYDPTKGTVRTWLLTLTQRRCVDRIRSERAAQRRELADARSRRPAHGVDIVAEEVERSFERQRVTDALQRLTALQREALDLAFFAGHTYREVAELLDAPLGTVKTRLRDGLLRLRRELGNTP